MTKQIAPAAAGGRLPVFARALPIDIGNARGGRSLRALSRSAGARFDVIEPKAAADGRTVVELYDEIGFWGTDAKQFSATLKGIEGDMTLRINSPGGDVFDGIAMYNELVAHKGDVRVEVMGLAASAASVIAMAGDTIAVAQNAFIMIHNAWTVWVGDRNEFREIADTLEGIDTALARTYAQKTGASLKTVREWMDDETWLDGEDAVAKGFADEVLGDVDSEAQARFDLSVFARTPESLRVAPDAIRAETVRDVERTLREAGFARSDAHRLIAACKSGGGQREAADVTEPAVPRDADAFNATAIASAFRGWNPSQ